MVDTTTIEFRHLGQTYLVDLPSGDARIVYARRDGTICRRTIVSEARIKRLRRLARFVAEDDVAECPHCGSRNTAALDPPERECHDCGETYMP